MLMFQKHNLIIQCLIINLHIHLYRVTKTLKEGPGGEGRIYLVRVFSAPQSTQLGVGHTASP